MAGSRHAVRAGRPAPAAAAGAASAANVRDQYHHGDLRRALLDQAVRTIQLHGVDELTLRGVGRDLGVSRTALYRHFADKAALVEAVAAQGFRTLRERLTEAWTQGGGGRRWLRRDGGGIRPLRAGAAVTLPRDVRRRARCGTRCDPDLTVEGAGAFQALVDAITWQQREGLLRDDDPLQLAQLRLVGRARHLDARARRPAAREHGRSRSLWCRSPSSGSGPASTNARSVALLLPRWL